MLSANANERKAIFFPTSSVGLLFFFLFAIRRISFWFIFHLRKNLNVLSRKRYWEEVNETKSNWGLCLSAHNFFQCFTLIRMREMYDSIIVLGKICAGTPRGYFFVNIRRILISKLFYPLLRKNPLICKYNSLSFLLFFFFFFILCVRYSSEVIS